MDGTNVYRMPISAGEVLYDAPPSYVYSNIVAFVQDEAYVKVNPIDNLTSRRASCLLLAGLGLSLEETSDRLYMCPSTVKATVLSAYKKVPTNGRNTITRYMLEHGHFEVERPADQLLASQTELDILTMKSFGATNAQIAELSHRSPLTIKSHLHWIAVRNKIPERQRLITRALLAGQISYQRVV